VERVYISIQGRHPPLKHETARARHGEQIAVPGRLGGVSYQRAVWPVVVDELLKIDGRFRDREEDRLIPQGAPGS